MRIRGSFGDELAPARGDSTGLGRRALDAQHYVGHGVQPLRRDRLPACVALPIRAFVELGQRTLRASQADLQRCADPDLGESTDRLDRAIPDRLPKPCAVPSSGRLARVAMRSRISSRCAWRSRRIAWRSATSETLELRARNDDRDLERLDRLARRPPPSRLTCCLRCCLCPPGALKSVAEPALADREAPSQYAPAAMRAAAR